MVHDAAVAVETDIYRNGDYLAKHPAWHAEDSPWKAMQVRRMMERNDVRPQSCCEVGCGSGAILAELQRTASMETRFWGYEISPQAYHLCLGRRNANLEFVLGDILEEPPADPFDVVLLMDVVEHVEDHLSFLRKVRGLGRAKIFHIPLDLSAQSVVRGVPSKVRETAGHLHYFTKDLALRTLEETGYRIVDFFYTPAALETASPGWRTRLMRLPRKLLFQINQDAAAIYLGGFSLMVLAI